MLAATLQIAPCGDGALPSPTYARVPIQWCSLARVLATRESVRASPGPFREPRRRERANGDSHGMRRCSLPDVEDLPARYVVRVYASRTCELTFKVCIKHAMTAAAACNHPPQTRRRLR
ncbi:hypothetical protein MTO96_049531 [Rhipicephalus appendiculatus]